MRRRPWLVLLAIWTWLVAMTILGALFINARLDAADAVLEFAAQTALDGFVEGDTDVELVQFCNLNGADEFTQVLMAFEDAIAVEQADESERLERDRTRTTLSSFLLDEASTHVTVGLNTIEIHSDRDDGGWCVSNAEHSTEEPPESAS